MVELKNGETYNGHLVNCDTWMNVHLKEVICTSKDGDRFWRVAETYIRGNTIKYIRVPDEIIEQVQDDVYVKKPEEQAPQPTTRAPTSARGGRRGRGPSDRSRGRWPIGRGRGKIPLTLAKNSR